MTLLKNIFHYFLYFGVKPSLSEGKKLAIQLATLDAYWSLVTIAFYIDRFIGLGADLIVWSYSAAFFLVSLGLWFFRKGYYDSGRILIHLTTLFCVFLGVDSAGIYSGAEYFYFTSMAIPFVIFTPDEQWKGNILALIAGCTLIGQMIVGTGLLSVADTSTLEDKIVAVLFVSVYFPLIFGVGRRQLNLAHKETERQYNELIQSSKMIALGELSSSIAHEINNPLQSLTLQLTVMKDVFKDPDLAEQLSRMDRVIFKMASMVKGLKDLARNSSDDPFEEFLLSDSLDDVTILTRSRLQEEDIAFSIVGDHDFILRGKQVQISQVLINLLNNAIDAVKDLPEKCIKVLIEQEGGVLLIKVMDSGSGIPREVKANMMNPFFTTKAPSKGTGLGLTISKSLIEKNGGRIFYDEASLSTTFVIEMPLSNT